MAYHPQSDGLKLVENMNKALRSMIVKYVHTFEVKWDQYLQQLLFSYRENFMNLPRNLPFSCYTEEI